MAGVRHRGRLLSRAARRRTAIVVIAAVGLEAWTRSVDEGFVLIPLTAMVAAFVDLTAEPAFWADVRTTLGIVGLSFLIATAGGVLVGTALGLSSPHVYTVIEPYLVAYYANPVFVFYPILVTVLGFGIAPIIVIAVLASVVSIVINTAIGIRQIKPTHIKLGRTLGMSRARILLRIGFPSSVPQLFTGLRLGLVYAFLATITSEFLLAPRGLGRFVKLQYESFQIEPMYGAILFIVVVAIAGNALLAWTENRLYRRQLEAF